MSHRHGVGEIDDDEVVHELDAIVAPAFDRAVAVYMAEMGVAKSENLAQRMGVDKHYLSRMRSGKKPIALRHILALLDCPAAIAKLEEPLNEEAGLEPARERQLVVLTEQDLKDEAFEMVVESEPLRFSLAHRVAQRKGVRPEYAMQLLKK